MKTSRLYTRRAFTLIELLVVIAIIAILMGLLIPSVTGVLENAKRVQAKNDVTQIATSVIAYETEYGKLPPKANIYDILGNLSDTDENPRGIVFLEIPDAKGGKNGLVGNQYKDSWGQSYNVEIDDDYDNSIVATTADGPKTVRKRVAVWSEGNPDKSPKPVYSWQ